MLVFNIVHCLNLLHSTPKLPLVLLRRVKMLKSKILPYPELKRDDESEFVSSFLLMKRGARCYYSIYSYS